MTSPKLFTAAAGAIIAAALFTACGPAPDMVMQHRQRLEAPAAPISASSRATVERIGVFKDDVAYNGRRAVYIVVDTQTGKEFIGVSGVGIAETGRHQSGKVSIVDER